MIDLELDKTILFVPTDKQFMKISISNTNITFKLSSIITHYNNHISLIIILANIGSNINLK